MSKKPDMPFATRGGCFVHQGDALVPQAAHTAIDVPADGSVSAELVGDGTGDALPEIPHVDDASKASLDEVIERAEKDGVDVIAVPLKTPRRRRCK